MGTAGRALPYVLVGLAARTILQVHIYFPTSFLTTSPPFITNLTRSSSVMSAKGSLRTATMSAYLPTSTAPMSFWASSNSAATTVAERRLASGSCRT